jgi:hypothetical protein
MGLKGKIMGEPTRLNLRKIKNQISAANLIFARPGEPMPAEPACPCSKTRI